MNEIEFSAGPPTSVEQAGRSHLTGESRSAWKVAPAGYLSYGPLLHPRHRDRVCLECGTGFVCCSTPTQVRCSPLCAQKHKTRAEKKRNLRRRVANRGTTVASTVAAQGGVAKQ